MSELKALDMSRFVDSNFDCEFFDTPDSDDREIGMFASGEVIISPLCKISQYDDGVDYWYQYDRNGFRLWKENCRPRLNKPQVLKNNSVLATDGLVWNMSVIAHNDQGQLRLSLTSVTKENLDWELRHYRNTTILWVECLGLEANPEWEAESERLGMPMIQARANDTMTSHQIAS